MRSSAAVDIGLTLRKRGRIRDVHGSVGIGAMRPSIFRTIADRRWAEPSRTLPGHMSARLKKGEVVACEVLVRAVAIPDPRLVWLWRRDRARHSRPLRRSSAARRNRQSRSRALSPSRCWSTASPMRRSISCPCRRQSVSKSFALSGLARSETFLMPYFSTVTLVTQ